MCVLNSLLFYFVVGDSWSVWKLLVTFQKFIPYFDLALVEFLKDFSLWVLVFWKISLFEPFVFWNCFWTVSFPFLVCWWLLRCLGVTKWPFRRLSPILILFWRNFRRISVLDNLRQLYLDLFSPVISFPLFCPLAIFKTFQTIPVIFGNLSSFLGLFSRKFENFPTVIGSCFELFFWVVFSSLLLLFNDSSGNLRFLIISEVLFPFWSHLSNILETPRFGQFWARSSRSVLFHGFLFSYFVLSWFLKHLEQFP